MNDMRAYFPYFEYNKDITYLDSANTSQILGSCLSSHIKYYYNYNYNIGRSSYSGARYAQQLKEWASQAWATFLHTTPEHIIFTTGATEGLNLVAKSFCGMFRHLGRKGIILTSKLEHASAILPWMVFGKDCIEIKYIDLNANYSLNIDKLADNIKEYQPDIILLSSMTNTTGEIRPIKEIGDMAKANDIAFIVDHAQGAAHVDINVEDCNIDFLACSAHKMYGPKGVGILYAKQPNFIHPIKVGGGMNKWFNDKSEFEFMDDTNSLYAGTENIPEIFASINAVDFVQNHWQQIKLHDTYLGIYAHKLLSRLPNIKLLSNTSSSILLFNVDGFEALDVMNYLDKKKIYIRAGNHCSKLTSDLFGLSTCRVSLGIYNTEEDINTLYKALKEMEDELCLDNAQDQNPAKLENVEQINVP